jgi:endogenous inhibitor of DNA gyrase (YacG/DUF329 family)
MAFDPSQSRSLPFCSERCRLIDLKRWLGEEYIVPTRPADPEEDDAPAESNGHSSDDDES